jgi:hypothetical protein
MCGAAARSPTVHKLFIFRMFTEHSSAVHLPFTLESSSEVHLPFIRCSPEVHPQYTQSSSTVHLLFIFCSPNVHLTAPPEGRGWGRPENAATDHPSTHIPALPIHGLRMGVSCIFDACATHLHYASMHGYASSGSGSHSRRAPATTESGIPFDRRGEREVNGR